VSTIATAGCGVGRTMRAYPQKTLQIDSFELQTKLRLTARLELSRFANRQENRLPDNSPATRADIQHLEDLITNLTQSLELELRTGIASVNDKLDGVNARLDRQGGLLRSGQTNLVRLNDWAETIDSLLAKRDKRIDDIDARLRRLEHSE
jgi:hypothetical protein